MRQVPIAQLDNPQDYLKSIDFLKNIGIIVNSASGDFPPGFFQSSKCFLTGIMVEKGVIYLNVHRATLPGLLHEAGHLATFPEKYRKYLNKKTISHFLELESSYGKIPEEELEIFMYLYDDLASQGWSYAVAHFLGLDLKTSFGDGFGDIGGALIEGISLSLGNKLGCLQSCSLYYLGMLESKASYPKLKKWINK